MNDDELRDALHAMTPEAPQTSDRADAARRRSRRTRGMVAGAGLLTVAVAAALAIGSLRPGIITGITAAPAGTAKASSAPASVPGAAPCHKPVTGGDIPGGALTLRLCPTGEAQLQQFAPADALDTDAAETVLAVLRGRPHLGTNYACPADLGPAFLLIAEYSGREPVVMELQLYGCDLVGTTTDRRTGGEEVLAAFRTALTLQRERNPGTGFRGGSLCPPAAYIAQGSVMPVTLADATGGSICGYADRSSARVQVERVLDAATFARITADLASNTSPWEPLSCGTGQTDRPAAALVLTTSWGDVLAIAHDECAGTYRYQTEGEELSWQPGSDVTALLKSLIG